jgi:2,5-dihydroxypyridine 5,6-dioxygenase
MVITMTPRTYPGEVLPEPINAAIKAADVVIGCVTCSIASPLWMNIGSGPEVTTRGASISNISETVMMAGGLWADPYEVMRITDGVYEIASKAETWRLTTKAGTDLTATIRSCRVFERLPISEPRMGGVLPGCEVAVDPVLGTVEGVFYSDGSCGALTAERLGYRGIINEPIKCTVKKGKIVDIEGGKEAKIFKDILESIGDPCAYMMNHLAIGCNPNCKMTGDYIHDEKILAGVHVANAGTKGCPSGNIDQCLQHPSLWLDDEQVIDDWKFTGPMAELQPK